MASRRRSTLDKVIRGLKSETFEKIEIVVLMILAIAFVSGVTYSISTNRPISIIFLRGGSMRIFVWNMLMQTHAETIVIFLYYGLGVAALLLYTRAISRPSDPRTTKYMLFFSFLLLLLASVGLYNAFVQKFITPS